MKTQRKTNSAEFKGRLALWIACPQPILLGQLLKIAYDYLKTAVRRR